MRWGSELLGEPPDQTDDLDLYRREAIGAFAHEVRTPLTSIRMVLELARRESNEAELILDEELAAMLVASVDDLQQLADDLQETSRMERRRVTLAPGPTDLAEAIAAAAARVAPDIDVAVTEPPHTVVGQWDERRLIDAVAGFIRAANRVGDGTGEVRCVASLEEGGALLTITSGEPGEERRPIAADAGFGFFRARQFILAMDGDFAWERTERYFQVRVQLPLV